jgi:hypothetical protein
MVGAGHRAPDLRAQCRCSAPTRAIPAGRVLVVRGYLTVPCLTPRSTLRLLEHCILRRSGVHYPSAGKSKRKSWVRPNRAFLAYRSNSSAFSHLWSNHLLPRSRWKSFLSGSA